MEGQRIAPLSPPYLKSIQDDFDFIMPKGIPPLNIFRTVANNPRVLHRMIHGGLLDKGSISIPDRELVILRSCGLCKAEYEWGVHVAVFAEKAGLSSQQVEDTIHKNISPGLWNDRQRTIIELVDQLHHSQDCDNSLWKKIQEHFQEDQIIELIMLCGLYHAVSFIVNSLKLENETFAPSFPV